MSHHPDDQPVPEIVTVPFERRSTRNRSTNFASKLLHAVEQCATEEQLLNQFSKVLAGRHYVEGMWSVSRTRSTHLFRKEAAFDCDQAIIDTQQDASRSNCSVIRECNEFSGHFCVAVPVQPPRDGETFVALASSGTDGLDLVADLEIVAAYLLVWRTWNTDMAFRTSSSKKNAAVEKSFVAERI